MEEMPGQNYRSSWDDTGYLRVQLSELGDAHANKIKASFWVGCLDVFVLWVYLEGWRVCCPPLNPNMQLAQMWCGANTTSSHRTGLLIRSISVFSLDQSRGLSKGGRYRKQSSSNYLSPWCR